MQAHGNQKRLNAGLGTFNDQVTGGLPYSEFKVGRSARGIFNLSGRKRARVPVLRTGLSFHLRLITVQAEFPQ
jgi:hypothetical protein